MMFLHFVFQELVIGPAREHERELWRKKMSGLGFSGVSNRPADSAQKEQSSIFIQVFIGCTHQKQAKHLKDRGG